MIFGPVPLADALNGIAAHNLKTADRVIRKGEALSADTIEQLQQAGYEEIMVARLEPGDLTEGEAANRLGELLVSDGLTRSTDVHGRVNLFAAFAGLLKLDTELLHRLNLIDEAIALATLADFTAVKAGDMIATLKIIPFAVRTKTVLTAETLLRTGAPVFSLRPFRALRTGLILTKLPALKDAAIKRTITVTQNRVESRSGHMMKPVETAHETAVLGKGIQTHLTAGADLILISGASAVTDRWDVAPQAIVQAGGQITRFGMPVDPGNLICCGQIGQTPVIVLPGCARSPLLNGIDWILDRVFAGEQIGHADIARMGIGGLLKESSSRPVPRHHIAEPGAAKTKIGAIVLAAGKSSRMGGQNKLLSMLSGGRPMIVQTVEAILGCTASPALVVTGHNAPQIRSALAGRHVQFVEAVDFANGMAASIATGIAALSNEVDAALICLGDMPLIETAVLEALIAQFDPTEGREIIVPVYAGQRGNPVLWGRRFFSDLMSLRGDRGGRQILVDHMEFVVEVPVGTDSVLRDFDTPEQLAELKGSKGVLF
jgi:molybdenum cofactor cytidylyltransferase